MITGASKGIGRAAADPLVEQGWSVIGVARSSPRHFPRVFIETDLADQKQTYSLAKNLAARATSEECSLARTRSLAAIYLSPANDILGSERFTRRHSHERPFPVRES